MSEALAVRKEDFKVSPEGIVLRITGQVAKGKDAKVALKHRDNKAFRDIPVPCLPVAHDRADGRWCAEQA